MCALVGPGTSSSCSAEVTFFSFYFFFLFFYFFYFLERKVPGMLRQDTALIDMHAVSFRMLTGLARERTSALASLAILPWFTCIRFNLMIVRRARGGYLGLALLLTVCMYVSPRGGPCARSLRFERRQYRLFLLERFLNERFPPSLVHQVHFCDCAKKNRKIFLFFIPHWGNGTVSEYWE